MYFWNVFFLYGHLFRELKSWLENNLFTFPINFKINTLGFIPKYLALCLTTKVMKIDHAFYFGCNESSSATAKPHYPNLGFPSREETFCGEYRLISRAATGNWASLPSFPILLLPCCYLSSFLFLDRTSPNSTALAFVILATDAGRVSYTHMSLVTQIACVAGANFWLFSQRMVAWKVSGEIENMIFNKSTAVFHGLYSP